MSNTINVNGMTSYYSGFIKSVMSQTSVDKGSKCIKEKDNAIGYIPEERFRIRFGRMNY